MRKRSRSSRRRMNSIFMTLLLTAVMLVMSTYAWFSSNRTVTINGITAKVTAAEGLQISLDGVTWGTSVTADASNLATAAATATGINDYLLPNELKPVSTIGATTGAEIEFFDGKVTPDGTQLDGAASATRTASTTSSTGKYIVFDVYLKNSSSQDKDPFQLGANSLVRLGTAEDKKGVENTGLENSVRVGFMLFGNTALPTASQSDLAALAVGTPSVSIWEPNYNKHINEVSSNDARIKTPGGSADFKTFGIKDASSSTLIGINGTAATAFMAETNTVRTDNLVNADTQLTTAVATGTGEGAVAAGSNMSLKGNAISKVRVYVWLEGQDPDCIDTASTGKYLDFVINFSKPSLT